MIVTVDRPTSLLDLRAARRELFYPQDWYVNHEFFARPVPPGMYQLVSRARRPEAPPERDLLAPAAVLALAYMKQHSLWAAEYVWTRDVDDFGNAVYVGMTAGDGRSQPGFQIHRLLTPDDRWGYVCVGLL